MGTRAGEMREMLIEAIEAVKTRKMDPAEAAAIAKLAGQVTLSLQVELNARRDSLLPKAQQLGALQLGDESTVEMKG